MDLATVPARISRAAYVNPVGQGRFVTPVPQGILDCLVPVSFLNIRFPRNSFFKLAAQPVPFVTMV
jgi:hypothetical protein